MAETKADKLKRIPAGASSQPPIPQWPKLPQFIYDKNPQHKAELDAYTAAIEEYFKKVASRSS